MTNQRPRKPDAPPTPHPLPSPGTGPLRGAHHAYHGAPPFGFPRGIGCADVIHFAASP
jgi:hypothetical protein